MRTTALGNDDKCDSKGLSVFEVWLSDQMRQSTSVSDGLGLGSDKSDHRLVSGPTSDKNTEFTNKVWLKKIGDLTPKIFVLQPLDVAKVHLQDSLAGFLFFCLSGAACVTFTYS